MTTKKFLGGYTLAIIDGDNWYCEPFGTYDTEVAARSEVDNLEDDLDEGQKYAVLKVVAIGSSKKSIKWEYK